MVRRVLTRRTKDFQVGSEDWNDVAFTRQIDELEEILVERNTREDLRCTPSMHP